MMKAAIVGGGVSGLAAAYVLAKEGVKVVVYEKEDVLGGYAKTAIIDSIAIDLGFMVFTPIMYPEVMELFESLGVDLEPSDISFSVTCNEGKLFEWGTRNGFASFFAQKRNILNPWFWKMMREISRFKGDASMYLEELETNLDIDRNETLEDFVRTRDYSELFKKAFLIPVCASIWSCSSKVMDFSSYSVLSFFRNHDILELLSLPGRLTPRCCSQSYVDRIYKELERRGAQIRTNSEVYSVMTTNEGMLAANGLLKKSFTTQNHPNKYMIPSFLETGARILITKFFDRFITAGCLILLEEGGSVFSFEGTRMSSLKVTLRVHTPQFYWKVATEADLGFADAYINGDVTFVDKNEGLLNFFLIIIANTEVNNHISKINKGRGWWTPLLYTSIMASVKYFLKNVSKKNTLSQARKNISQHYDLSNEFFSLFLDETMTYSCAIFQTSGEDLKNAQLRKVHTLIDKAKINKEHHILEIGCGWGNFALEVVKRIGCKYTGITLSKPQLEYVESKVKDAGLEDQIELILCDYRQLPSNIKFDRIISCEMIEHVGHDFMEEFFKCCEFALADNGLLVLQFGAVADDKYDETRLSPGFIKEYIFPGGCLPSLSRVTSAMANATRLSVVHLEEIGCHYFNTLRHWRQNLLHNQSKILGLGFDDRFIRTWEYYFDYCAAGFKYCVIVDYQIVFSRLGDVAAFGNDPYNHVSSTYK